MSTVIESKNTLLKRILKVLGAAFLIFILTQLFWSLSSIIIYDHLYINKSLNTKGSIVEDSLRQHIKIAMPRWGIDPIIVRNYDLVHTSERQVDIFGNGDSYQEVLLSVNELPKRVTQTDFNGQFAFHNIYFGFGINKIRIEKRNAYGEIADSFSASIVLDNEEYNLPELFSTHYIKATNQLSVIGMARPATSFELLVAGKSHLVLPDYYGTFRENLVLPVDTTFDVSVVENEIDMLDVADSLSGLSQQKDFYRIIDIRIDSLRKNPEAKLTVQLPVSSIIYQNFFQGLISPDLVVKSVFGKFDEWWKTRNANITDGDNYGLITIELRRDPSDNQESIDRISISSGVSLLSEIPLFAEHDTLKLTIAGSQFYNLSHSSTLSHGSSKIFVGYKNIHSGKPFVCEFFTDNESPSESTTVTKISPREFEKEIEPLPENLITLIRKLPSKILGNKFINLAVPFIDSIFHSIPLLWFLWIIIRYRGMFGDDYLKVKGITILFLFISYFDAVARTIERTHLFLIDLIVKNTTGIIYAYLTDINTAHYSILVILIMAPISSVLVPNFTLDFPRWLKILKSIFAWIGLLLIMMMIGLILQYVIGGDLKSQQIMLFYGIGGIVVGSLFIWLTSSLLVSIVRNSANTSISKRRFYSVFIFLLLIPLLLKGIDYLIASETKFVGWGFFSSLIGAFLLYALYKLIVLVLDPTQSNPSKKTFYLLLFLFLILAFPKSILFSTDNNYWIYYNLRVMLRHILDYLPLVMLLIVVLFLVKEGEDSTFKPNELTKEFAVYMVSIFVVGFGYYWMYIPISFLISYNLSKNYLFLNPVSSFKQIEENSSVLNDRKEAIRKVISYLNFRRHFKALRKTYEKKLTNGEIDYDVWKENISQNKNILTSLYQKAQLKGVPYRQIIFSHSLEKSHWESVKAALQVGSVLAVPMIFIFIREFRNNNIENLYPLLSVIDLFLNELAIWFVIAFVLGYFFDMINGKNGIEKGLWLSLVIIFSRIGPAVFFADGFTQVAKLLSWGVQVFIYCILLGFFAFDFRTLKRNGYGWKEVEVIYNLAFLSTFGSTLIAALLGILSGQLQGMFKSILEFLFGSG